MKQNKKNPYRTFDLKPIKATVKPDEKQPASKKTVITDRRGRRES
jgi:hypothetical protein